MKTERKVASESPHSGSCWFNSIVFPVPLGNLLKPLPVGESRPLSSEAGVEVGRAHSHQDEGMRGVGMSTFALGK